MSNSQDTVNKKEKPPWDDSIKTVLIAFILALFFRSVAFEPFHIPSGSMKNTLLVGDYLFVSKYSYGYSRYSFPLGMPLFEGRVLGDKPQRGDVMVFRLPANPRIDFIKRLIGLPGDTIQVKSGQLYINGEAIKREQLPDATNVDENFNARSVASFKETLPNGVTYTTLEEVEDGPADNTELYHIPEGHYFMMGDNRDNSRDSRFLSEVGYIPEENIIGKAQMIFFSADGSSELKNPMSWVKALRGDRFFKKVE